MKEIFQKLALKLIDDIGDQQWNKVVLDIIRFDKTVRFSAIYTDEENNIKNLEVNFGFWEARIIHKLHDLTQTQPPIHKNWNRAKYTLYPDAKMEIEYSWDQRLQDEVDKLNNKTT